MESYLQKLYLMICIHHYCFKETTIGPGIIRLQYGVSHSRLYMDPVHQRHWQLLEVKARILVDTKGDDKFPWLSINNPGVVNSPFQPSSPKVDLVIHIAWQGKKHCTAGRLFAFL